MEQKRKQTNKTAITFAMIGITLALLWQFGPTLLREGPLGDFIKRKAAAAPVSTSWEYKEVKDNSTGAIIKGARLNSVNTADTGFGPNGRVMLVLTETDGHKNAAIHAPQGVLECTSSPDDCPLDMKFDDGSVETVTAYYANQNLLMADPDKMISKIKAARQLTVDVGFVTNKGKVRHTFRFDTAGLSWE